jgi:hypothetical protein
MEECMTRDDILMMAKEAGIDAWWDSGDENRDVLQDHLERFAALVAAHEREACAKVCGLVAQDIDDTNGLATYCAEAIRARGEK